MFLRILRCQVALTNFLFLNKLPFMPNKILELEAKRLLLKNVHPELTFYCQIPNKYDGPRSSRSDLEIAQVV